MELSLVQVAAIAIGAALLCLIGCICFLCYCCWLQRERSQYTSMADELRSLKRTVGGSLARGRVRARGGHRCAPLHDLRDASVNGCLLREEGADDDDSFPSRQPGAEGRTAERMADVAASALERARLEAEEALLEAEEAALAAEEAADARVAAAAAADALAVDAAAMVVVASKLSGEAAKSAEDVADRAATAANEAALEAEEAALAADEAAERQSLKAERAAMAKKAQARAERKATSISQRRESRF